MLKNLLVAFVLIGSTISLFGQSKLAFWKKDREYAKNSFSINTSGPIPGGGFSFSHQLNRQTTISAFYGESEGVDIDPSDAITFGEGDTKRGEPQPVPARLQKAGERCHVVSNAIFDESP